MNVFNLLAKLTPFNWSNISPTFTILWKGLLAIFTVIFIIIIVVQLVNFSVNKIEKMKKEREEKKQLESGEQNPNERE